MLGAGCGKIAALLLLAAAACDSGPKSSSVPPPDPAGDYIVGNAYADTLRIKPRGAGYSLAWRAGDRTTFGGMTLYTGNILGGVYWNGDEAPDSNLRVMVYRIEAGLLSGTWIPVGVKVTTPGREELSDTGSLEGRHDIVLGQRPDQRGAYTGNVEIFRAGPTYEARWSQNGATFWGRGIRIGDVLVFGYSDQDPPDVIAYCMTPRGALGVYTGGRSDRVSHENAWRNASDVGSIARVGTDCP